MKEAKTPKRARQLRDLILSWMAEANSCRLGELAGITPADIRKGLEEVVDCKLTLEGVETDCRGYILRVSCFTIYFIVNI